VNAAGKKCMGAEGDTVVLTGCDSGSTWETQGNGACFASAIHCYRVYLKLLSLGVQAN
jgi:hypothetical protein